MSFVDDNRLDKIYRLIHSTEQRKLLMIFNVNSAFTYGELKEKSGFMAREESTKKNGLFAYYLRKIRRTNLVKKDDKHYMLTRSGITLIKLLKSFEKISKTYDMNDCDDDGKIKYFVERP